jgi:hypothetical protein
LSNQTSKPSPFSQRRQIATIGQLYKIILNKKVGGWGLSLAAIKWLIKNKDLNVGIIVDRYRRRPFIVEWIRYPEYSIDIFLNLSMEVFESYSKDPNMRHALERYITESWYFQPDFTMNFLRTHPDIIECIETLGSQAASGVSSNLQIETLLLDFNVKDESGFETLLF